MAFLNSIYKALTGVDVESLLQKLSEREAEVQELKAKIASQATTITLQSTKIKELNKNIKESLESIEITQTQLTEVKVANSLNYNARLVAEEKLSKVEKDFSEEKKNKSAVEQMFNDTQLELSKANNQIEELSEKNNFHSSEIRRLTDLIDKASVEKNSLKEKLETVQKSLSEAEQKTVQQTNLLQQEKEKSANAEQLLSKAESDSRELNSELSAAKSQISELSTKLQQTQNEKGETLAENLSLNKQLQELSEKIALQESKEETRNGNNVKEIVDESDNQPAEKEEDIPIQPIPPKGEINHQQPKGNNNSSGTISSSPNYSPNDQNISRHIVKEERKTIPTAVKNTGERRAEDVSEFHDNKFEYIGFVDYDFYLGENDHTTFPAIKTPCKGTKILNCYKSNKEAVVGVTEPLLMSEVEKICEKYDGLTILKNVALPILNRRYSYRPDIALYWSKYKIYVDIEIDEPYDICNREPLHYIGCSDNLRDKYFTRNGWCVVRYSEHQVLHNMDEIIKHLEFVLTCLVGKSFKSYSFFEENRWTYEEALQMANLVQREKDLGVEGNNRPSAELNKPTDSHNDAFIKPGNDILPDKLEDSYESIIEAQLNYVLASDAQYVKIADTYGIQWILEKNTIQIKIEDGCRYIKGNNPICPSLSSREYKLNEIIKITSLSMLFATGNRKSGNAKSVKEILVDAASNGSPIWIKYKNAKNETSERFLCNVCLCYESIKSEFPFTELGVIPTLEDNRIIYIFGLCSIRNEFRTFACDDRLLEIKIVNCTYSFISPKVYQNTLAELVMNPHKYKYKYFDRVDYLLRIMPDDEKNSLISQGNMANYEVIKGNIAKALDLYKSVSFDHVMYESNEKTYIWGKVCIDDIERYINEFKDKENNNHNNDIVFSKMVEDFIQIKSLLKQAGWEWPN